MNSKVQTFAQLATGTSGQLTSSYAEWTHFLETAARLYKYPYHEQVLIYAQRPEATACASYDVWSKRMGRGVRRGSKGIGLLSANGVRYVFDISDTVGRDGSRKPYLWEYRKEHAEAVVAALAEQYGVTDEGGLPYQLEAIAQELAGEYWEQNWEDILASVPGSFLEDYDELNVEVEFRNAVTVSTTYALMSRCGLNPSEFFTHEDFLPVFDFNTPDSITALGTAVSGNSEQVLRQIEVTIKNYERTRRVERSGLYGEQPDLPAGGELPSARIRGGNTIDFGEIRTDEGAVSPGGTPGAVQPADTQRETDGSPDGDRADGEPEAGAADAPAEGEYGPDGTDESERPLEVGGADEQREGEGGGDGTGRADLPVTSPSAIDFTAVGPTGLQYSHRELNSTAIPYFEDISEKRELLIKSDALKKRQVEVAEYFAAHTPPDERVQFVKSLFNNTYTEIILDSGRRVGYRAYDDCLHLWRGPYTDREQEEYLSWEDVSSAIEGLMQGGLWAEPMEQLTLEIGAPEKVTQDEDYIPNLFDLAGSTIPLTNEPVESSATVQPGLSQNVIDAALTLGANDSDSRLRIVAEFMKDKPLAENVRFLQAHYKENGAGFYVGERKYSLWYNEAGMQIAPGESALTFTAIALTWEQAAERIRVLLDEGRYASQSMLYRAWPFEKNRVAEALEYLHRDIDDEHKDKYLPTLTAALSGTFGYPDVVDKTKELLEQPEQLKRVIDDFALFQRDYAHNRDILRFHFHRPDEIMQGLQDLQCTPLKFTASPDFMPVERFFISQDEIDRLLRQGNGHGDYRITVFTFFEQHPDRKEREKYLSSLHGVYSGYHGGNDNITYTTKELTFTHGDIIEPYAAVKMKWSQVRKRIEELIKKDAFLSPEDREIMESRALETPSEKIDPFETAKSLIRKFRQSDRDSLDFSDLSKVLLTNAITENEKHGIDVFADLDNFRLLFEVNGQTVSTLQFHDVNDLNDHLEKLSAAELIEFAKEQFVINLNNEAPPKISEQDAKKHDILMANTRAHFASYEEVKQAHPGDIVLFQRGDFFEMYGPDARVASVELDIHLLNRNIPELGRVAMCGITAGSLEKSLEILRKKYGVTVSALPEKGTERQTYSLPSFDSELDTAKKRIQDFCQQEYGSDADFSDLEHVSLAYTTTGNSEQEIQVEADLVHFVLTKYLDGQVCDEYHYNSLRELTEAELSGMNFDGLVTLETDDAAEITATPDSQSTQILDSTFNYRRLSQMKADCDYFLGAGNRAEKHLWHGNIHEHIGEMRRIYGLLPEKPEWLTTEEIDSYAQRMARRYQVVVYHTIVNGFDEMPESHLSDKASDILSDTLPANARCGELRKQYWGQQMAQTKIWPISNHLGRSIRYIMNPAKTQEGKLVTGVNLFIPQNDWQAPADQMLSTKLRFGKQGGRLAYHLEQGFLPGEVTPEVAHEIGVELAKELFGDKYEVVVATHTDKEHIHNHILLNSVSFVDGSKFHQPNAMYYDRIRKLSDQLCARYGLSVIKEAKQSRYESYPAQHHQKPQPAPTVHSIMYQDIDRAVDAAKDLDDFYRILTQMGYRVKRDGKYPAISPEGHGFFRLYKFKSGYTEEDIRKRIAEKSRNPHQRQKPKQVYGAWKNPTEQQAYKKRYTGYYARRYDRRGLNATYLHYRYMLVSIRRQSYPRYPTIEQRKALAKLDKYSQEARLLVRNKIHTREELSKHQSDFFVAEIYIFFNRNF